MKKYYCTVDSVNKQTKNSLVLNLKIGDRRKIKFKPGQYALLSIYHKGKLGKSRPFSLAGSPNERENLEFGIRIGGKFTNQLTELKPGDIVAIKGPFGSFTFDEDQYEDAVFLAGGVGITPFMSTFRFAAERKIKNKLTLIYSNKALETALYFSEINNFARVNENFLPYFVFTDYKPSEEIEKNIMLGRIDLNLLKKILGEDLSKKHFFICGPAGFVRATIKNLSQLGVKKNQILTEGFSLAGKMDRKNARIVWPSAVVGTSVIASTFLYFVYPNALPKTSFSDTQKEVKPAIVITNTVSTTPDNSTKTAIKPTVESNSKPQIKNQPTQNKVSAQPAKPTVTKPVITEQPISPQPRTALS